jgi:methylmalonyl-CoA epimerase
MNKPILDHIGIAVADLDAAVETYRALGFEQENIEDVPGFGVKVAFLPMESGNVELVTPTTEDSAMAKFLEKKGPGIHHLCFKVDDIRAELARLARPVCSWWTLNPARAPTVPWWPSCTPRAPAECLLSWPSTVESKPDPGLKVQSTKPGTTDYNFNY